MSATRNYTVRLHTALAGLRRAAVAASAGQAGEVRAIVALSAPIVMTNLGQIAMSTTDVVMMGQLGADTLAAGSIGSVIFFIQFVFAMGVVMAVAPIMAQERGQRPHAVREIRRTVRQGMWVALTLGVPAMFVFLQAPALLRLAGQPAELIDPAADYAHAIMWGFVPGLWVIVLRNFVAALERPRAAMYVTFAAIAVNGVADYVLIFGKFGAPQMGAMGAGLATAVSNLFMLLALTGYIYVDRRFRRYHVLGRFWRPDWPRYREIFRLGAPIGITLLLEVGLFAAAAVMIGQFGPAALAANQVALQCASVTFMVPMGLAQAATVRVGLAAGRGDRAGARRSGLTALVLGCGFMGLMGFLMLLFPRTIAGWFIDLGAPDNAAVAQLVAGYLTVAALFQVLDGGQAIGAGALRGLKDTRLPMFFAGVSYWLLGLPVALWLGFEAGLEGLGVWVGLLVGLGAAAIFMIGRFFVLVREKVPARPGPLPAVPAAGDTALATREHVP
jgi:multidrug resistance protein, MATE family